MAPPSGRVAAVVTFVFCAVAQHAWASEDATDKFINQMRQTSFGDFWEVATAAGVADRFNAAVNDAWDDELVVCPPCEPPPSSVVSAALNNLFGFCLAEGTRVADAAMDGVLFAAVGEGNADPTPRDPIATRLTSWLLQLKRWPAFSVDLSSEKLASRACSAWLESDGGDPVRGRSSEPSVHFVCSGGNSAFTFASSINRTTLCESAWFIKHGKQAVRLGVWSSLQNAMGQVVSVDSAIKARTGVFDAQGGPLQQTDLDDAGFEAGIVLNAPALRPTSSLAWRPSSVGPALPPVTLCPTPQLAPSPDGACNCSASAEHARAVGNETGYSTGWAAGNATGYFTGWAAGSTTGYFQGQAAGNATGDVTSCAAGNETGYSTGWAAGNASGYFTGWALGNTTGYFQGQAAGNATGYFTGCAAGNETSFLRGLTAGNETGYVTGHREGHYSGYSAGRADGHDAGFAAGRAVGACEGNTSGFSLGHAAGVRLGNATGFRLGHAASALESTRTFLGICLFTFAMCGIATFAVVALSKRRVFEAVEHAFRRAADDERDRAEASCQKHTAAIRAAVTEANRSIAAVVEDHSGRLASAASASFNESRGCAERERNQLTVAFEAHTVAIKNAVANASHCIAQFDEASKRHFDRTTDMAEAHNRAVESGLRRCRDAAEEASRLVKSTLDDACRLSAEKHRLGTVETLRALESAFASHASKIDEAIASMSQGITATISTTLEAHFAERRRRSVAEGQSTAAVAQHATASGAADSSLDYMAGAAGDSTSGVVDTVVSASEHVSQHEAPRSLPTVAADDLSAGKEE